MTERTYTADEVDAMIARALAREREQPAQQPTNCRHCGGADNVLCAGQCKVQPAQQEPVAPTAVEMQNAAANLALMRELWGNSDEPAAKVNDEGFIVETGLLLSPGTKLYTSPQPAQRTWVGLTDEEMFEAIRQLYSSDKVARLAVSHSKDEYRAIEAKLKEKNT